MNTKKLTEKLFEDLGPKIVCLGLAILLYVFNRISTLERKTITVPLKVEASGLMMPYSDVPRYVKIHVRSSAENVSSINASSFIATLNLDNFTDAGNYSVPVTITTSQNLMLLDTLEYSCHPEVINVELDEKIVKYIPVKPVYSGEVAHGYEITNVDISPSTVKVVGPSLILNKTKQIYTRKVNVNGASLSLSQEVKLDNINHKLEVLPEGDFKVTVSINPASGTKEFDNVIPVCMGLSDTLMVEGDLPKIDVKVAGQIPVLESYELGENTVAVDLSAIFEPGKYEVPVNVKLPLNIELESVTKEIVSINIVSKIVEVDETASEKNDDGDKKEKSAAQEKSDFDKGAAAE